MVVEIENRIADQLPGAVIGHIATPLHFRHVQPLRSQCRRREGKAAFTGAATEGHDGIVLHQQQDVIADLGGDTAIGKIPLQSVNLVVPRRPRSIT